MASMPWRVEAAFLPRFEVALGRGPRAPGHDEPATASRARLSEEQQRALMSRLRLAVLAISPNFAVPDESAKVPGAALVAKAAASEPAGTETASLGSVEQNNLPPPTVRGMERAQPFGPVLVGRDLGLTVNRAEAKRHRAERDLIVEAQSSPPRLLAFVHGVVPRAASGNASKKGAAADRLRGVERAVVTITDASDDRVVLREVPAQLCLLAWAQPGMPAS